MPEVEHDERPDPLEWAHEQLAIAVEVLSQHGFQGGGMCRCGNSWECGVYAKWAAYQRYWQLRLPLIEAVRSPKVLMQLVTAC